MTRTLAVVTAGLSVPSSTRLLADRLSDAVTSSLAAQGVGVEVSVVELREHARALADNLVTGFPPSSLRPAVESVTGADGVIAVTPIFSGSYSGLFKTFFDVLDKESLVDVPVLAAATAGTARHSLALEHAVRPLFAYLRAVVVPTAVFAAPEDWAGGGPTGPLASRITRAADELAALVAARPARAVAGGLESVPFEELLSQVSRRAG